MTRKMIQEAYARPKLIIYTRRIARVWCHSTPALAAGITLKELQHMPFRFRLTKHIAYVNYN